MVMVALDTNVVVALVDDRDTWHGTAVVIRYALLETHTQLIYFDCVFNETIGVIGRRTGEPHRSEQCDCLLEGLMAIMPSQSITWIGGAAQLWFDELVRLCRESYGMLNFYDALVALAYQELGVRLLVSFDPDFDQIPWLTRIRDVAQIATFVRHPTTDEPT
jgi:predicted nucleic acid-binding protein